MTALICLALGSPLVMGQDPRKPPPNPTSSIPQAKGGIDFGGKNKLELLPNPYRFNAALLVVAQAIPQVIENQKLTLDEEKSRPRNGLFVTKPHVFTRGIVVSKPELQRVTQLPAEETRSWERGRFSLEIRMSPISATATHVTVIATIEGLAQNVLSRQWVKGDSKGVLEDEFLKALREYIELR